MWVSFLYPARTHASFQATVVTALFYFTCLHLFRTSLTCTTCPSGCDGSGSPHCPWMNHILILRWCGFLSGGVWRGGFYLSVNVFGLRSYHKFKGHTGDWSGFSRVCVVFVMWRFCWFVSRIVKIPSRTRVTSTRVLVLNYLYALPFFSFTCVV